MRIFLSTTLFGFFGVTNFAFAHGGHLGELAGHAHWVGVAAVLGVAGIAAILTKGKKEQGEESSDEEATELETEAGETV